MNPYYQDDSVTIYHGDAMSVLPHLANVQLVVTDPPYFQPATHYVSPRGKHIQRSVGDMSILEYVFRGWVAPMVAALDEGSSIYIFCDGQTYPLAFTALYPHVHAVRPLVWDKVVSYNGYTWRHQHEFIAWASMPDAPRIATGEGDILRCRAVPVGERTHPAEKPLELVSRLIAKHDASVILDPFMGSGTTLRAAKDTGRKAIGIEIEERYCEIAAKRCAQEVLALGKM